MGGLLHIATPKVLELGASGAPTDVAGHALRMLQHAQPGHDLRRLDLFRRLGSSSGTSFGGL